MTTNVDSITSIAFQGVGMSIIAGTAMHTMDMMDRSVNKKHKQSKPLTKPKTIKQYKLNLPKSKYRYRY